MAQHDYVIANGTGAAVRSDLNDALAAIVSNNSGASEPTTTYAYMWWPDSSTGLLKLRNGANNAWITLRQLDGDFTTVSVDNGSNSAPSIYFNASGTDTGIYSSGTDAVDITTAGTRRFGVASGGDVTVYGGNVTLNAQGDLRFADSDSSNWVAFQSPPTVASNVTWTLPAADGTTGQVLSTDGSGALSWATASATVDKIVEGNTEAEVVDTGADGHFKVTTEGTERLRVDPSGRLLVGTSSSRGGWFNTSGQDPLIQTETTTQDVFSGVQNSNSALAPWILLGKSRGATAGAVTVVQNGDPLGGITFQGADGTQMVEGARIQAYVDGTPGADDLPTRLEFSTTADGASSPTERMRITSGGQLQLNLPSNTTSRHIGITNAAGTIGWTFGNGITSSARQFVVYDNEAGAARTVIDSSGNFKFNSGYGSAATAYGVRAWVNFNGQGTVAIRASGNVSSITDQGTGLYRINFTTAMVDANYSAVGSSGEDDNNTTPNNHGFRLQRNSPLTGSVPCATCNEAGTPTDHKYICCTVVR